MYLDHSTCATQIVSPIMSFPGRHIPLDIHITLLIRPFERSCLRTHYKVLLAQLDQATIVVSATESAPLSILDQSSPSKLPQTPQSSKMESDFDGNTVLNNRPLTISKYKILQGIKQIEAIFDKLQLNNLGFHLRTMWLFPRSNFLEMVIMPFVFAMANMVASSVLDFLAVILPINIVQKTPKILF